MSRTIENNAQGAHPFHQHPSGVRWEHVRLTFGPSPACDVARSVVCQGGPLLGQNPQLDVVIECDTLGQAQQGDVIAAGETEVAYPRSGLLFTGLKSSPEHQLPVTPALGNLMTSGPAHT